MNDVTRILSLIDEGDSKASEQLLTLVYDELRRLAAARLAEEKPGQTLQATALVHEAYLSLVGSDTTPAWDSRGHFFAAAAEAMRRILVDRARRKNTIKRGGDRVRVDLVEHDLMVTAAVEEVLAVDEILERLGEEDSLACAVLKLKYYAGMSVDDAASALGISRATAYRHWTYARAYVRSVLLTDDSDRKN
jgi:RNA polymerase sigma factor (TIGR02999 family)